MSKPAILFYDPGRAQWGDRLRQYCAFQGIRLRPVEREDLGRTVGSLTRGLAPAGDEPPALPVPEPVLVLCGLRDAQLDRLLAALGKMGARGCLKAVLTPANAGWTFSALYRELCRERLAMGGGH